MSLVVPLAVRLKTSRADRHITRDLRDLSFRSSVPGGFASASFSFDRPLTLQPDEVDYYASVYIYDRRSGAVVWEGRLEDPGRTAGYGQIWRMTAVGPSAHARDRTVPLIYVDRGLTVWEPRTGATNQRTDIAMLVTDDPGQSGNQALVLAWPEGAVAAASQMIAARYWALSDAGQKLARFAFTVDSGTSSASMKVQVLAFQGGTSDTPYDVAWSSTATAASRVIGTDWTSGRDVLEIRSVNTSGGGIAGAATTWSSLYLLTVRGTLFNQSGTELVTGASYTTNTVLSSAVVADLLGRLLPKFDGANASIATTAYGIESLAYPDGVTAEEVLSDLMAFDPAYYWAAWESNAAGKHRFEWSQWPTTVRYECDITDGFDSPGSAADLYNAVTVRYLNEQGRSVTRTRTQTVAALTAAGLTRTGFVNLTSLGVRTATDADRVGDQWLAERATPPNAGSLTVARPIRDLVTGRTVSPWEILPGNLIRVRGVLPRVDALNATARDGVTVFRIVESEFTAASASARLSLDSYPLTVARAIAKASARRR